MCVNTTQGQNAAPVINANGVVEGASFSQQVTAGGLASIFAADFGSIPGATSRPARAGEYISIYCSELGDVTNQPADGAASPSDKNLATIKSLIEVGIDSQFAIPSFAGMAPGFVGLCQVDVQIPPGVSGPRVPVTVIVNGVYATTVASAVQ